MSTTIRNGQVPARVRQTACHSVSVNNSGRRKQIRGRVSWPLHSPIIHHSLSTHQSLSPIRQTSSLNCYAPMSYNRHRRHIPHAPNSPTVTRRLHQLRHPSIVTSTTVNCRRTTVHRLVHVMGFTMQPTGARDCLCPSQESRCRCGGGEGQW